MKVKLGRWFEEQGYMVLIDAKHNAKDIWRGEMRGPREYGIGFSPDGDVIAMWVENGTIKEVVGVEVKGYQKGGKLPELWKGLGEAMLYLINPQVLDRNSKSVKGSIFDRVYLCYPTGDAYGDEEFVELVSTTPVGLMTWEENEVRILLEAKENPFVNREIKEIFGRYLQTFVEGYGLWKYKRSEEGVTYETG